jgi:hypothetical protein
MKNIRIKLIWARRRAAEFVRRVLENQMSAGDEYWRAYRKWKRLSPVKGTEAARRLSREQAHARR